jgi:hypothetical protein
MEKQEKHNVFIDKREKETLNTRNFSSHELVKMKFDKLLGKAPKERGGTKRKNVFNLAVCCSLLSPFLCPTFSSSLISVSILFCRDILGEINSPVLFLYFSSFFVTASIRECNYSSPPR